MNILLILLRLLHIGGAVFWAGSAFFVVAVLLPTVKEAGPDGGKFMQRLAASGRMSKRIAMASTTTVLSGLLLYWIVSGGLNNNWMMSGYGSVITIGAIFGLLAYLYGLFATAKASDRMGALAKEMQSRQGPPPPELLQEAQALGAKLGKMAVHSTILVSLALAAMATAQYF